jgi:tripartite-type tricarboxylate transporter receptor subunit TctC/transcriptional regulator with XRE-family HTH domain
MRPQLVAEGQPSAERSALALLGQRIRVHRLQHRQRHTDRPWSQEDLAVAIGSDKAHVNRLECGRQCPAPETLQRICDALELPWPARRRLLGLAGLLEGPPAPGRDDEVRLAALFDRVLRPLAYPAWAVDQDGRICDANEAFARFFLDYPDRDACLGEVRGCFLLELMCEHHRAGRHLRAAVQDFDALALRHLLVLRRALQRQAAPAGLRGLLDVVLADRRLCALWLRHSADLDPGAAPDFLDHQQIAVLGSPLGPYAVQAWRSVLAVDERFAVVHLVPTNDETRARFVVRARGELAGPKTSATARPAGRRRAAFPARPLILTVPWAVGGVTDVGARLLAPVAARLLGQPIQVANLDAEQSPEAVRHMAAQAADGHHLGIVNQPALDALGGSDAGLTFVATHACDPFGVFLRPESRYASLRDLVRGAQRRPGEITVGTSGRWTPAHVAALMLAEAADIRFRYQHFRGSLEHIARFLAGQTDIAFLGSGISLRAVRAEELRALGMFTPERFELLPDVPTMAEAGFPGLTLASLRTVFAPAATPRPTLGVLRQAFADAVAEPAHVAALHAAGLSPLGLDEAGLRQLCAEQAARYRRLLRREGEVGQGSSAVRAEVLQRPSAPAR